MRDKWNYKVRRTNPSGKASWEPVKMSELRLGDVFRLEQRRGGPSPVGYAVAHVATSDPYEDPKSGALLIDTANVTGPIAE